MTRQSTALRASAQKHAERPVASILGDSGPQASVGAHRAAEGTQS